MVASDSIIPGMPALGEISFGSSAENYHRQKHRMKAWTFFPIAGVAGMALTNIALRKRPLCQQMPVILGMMAGLFGYSNYLSLSAIVEERSHK